MATITWLGEDDLHNDGCGPGFTTWNGVRFDIGAPVEVSDPIMIAKAKGNPFFDVDGSELPAKRGPGRPRKTEPLATNSNDDEMARRRDKQVADDEAAIAEAKAEAGKKAKQLEDLKRA